MSAPKSVIKFKKSGIVYESNIDWCEYTLRELCRAALRDVGRYVRKGFRTEFYKTFKRHTGNAPKAVSQVVYSSENTRSPRIDIGLPHAYRGNPVKGFYSFFQEVGTSKQKKLAILTNFVGSHVNEIREIEGTYLSAIEDKLKAERLINEQQTEESDE